MRFDSPKNLGFFPEIFECCVVSIMLLFQFCIPGLDGFAFNAKGKAAEIGAFLDKYIPTVEQMHTTLKKYNTAFTATTAENKKLKKKTEQLAQLLDKATKESTLKKLADAKLHRDYEDAVAVLDRIPKEVLAAYTHRTEKERETAYGR